MSQPAEISASQGSAGHVAAASTCVREPARPKRSRPEPSAESARGVDGMAVDNVRDLIKWMCCNTKMVSFKQNYILSKNSGSTADQFNVVSNFLTSVSLATEKESGKGGGKGTLVLQRPESSDHLNHVAAAFKMWFGTDEGDMRSFMDKLKTAEVAADFAKEVFDLVMAAINTHGTYREGKKTKAQGV